MVRTAEQNVDTAMVMKPVMLRVETARQIVRMVGEMTTVKGVRMSHNW